MYVVFYDFNLFVLHIRSTLFFDRLHNFHRRRDKEHQTKDHNTYEGSKFKHAACPNASAVGVAFGSSTSSATTDAGKRDMEALKRRLMGKNAKGSVPVWAQTTQSSTGSSTNSSSSSGSFVADTEATLKRKRDVEEEDAGKLKKKKKKDKKDKKKKKKKKKDE